MSETVQNLLHARKLGEVIALSDLKLYGFFMHNVYFRIALIAQLSGRSHDIMTPG